MTESKAPEQRTIDVDVEDVDTRGRTLHGYAAIYGATSGDLGGFRETIAPGAFAGVMDADVRCLLNHDPSQVLGRSKSGTLRLADEQRGLRFECDLPDSPLGENVRAAVRRGDIDGASFRFQVGEEAWDGDLRMVKTVKALHDVTVATYGAYPDASVELRTRPNHKEGQHMSEESTAAVPAEEARAEDNKENEEPENRGSLKVEDRVQRPGGRGLAEEFRSRGFPGERASMGWDEYRAITLPSPVDDLSPSRQEGVALGHDQRWAFTAVQQVAVDAATTSVQVLRQTSRTLPAAASVVRTIDATSEKPEVATVLEVGVEPLKQVAATEQGIPNIALEQNTAQSIIETDLRLAVNEGLDSLVLDELYLAPSIPAGPELLVAIRQAITVVQAAGYAPNTLLLPPTDAEALDTLVTGVSGADNDYVFAPGQFAPGSLFGLSTRIVKGAADPFVLDASAVGKLYVSPISLSRFEENAGQTNTSTVRLEGHAAFGVERLDAAVVVGTAS